MREQIHLDNCMYARTPSLYHHVKSSNNLQHILFLKWQKPITPNPSKTSYHALFNNISNFIH